MQDPRQLNKFSNMPAYPWLFEGRTDVAALPAKLRVQRTLGVPYPDMTDEEILTQANQQAEQIAVRLLAPGTDIFIESDREIIALLAYLQQLGKSQPTNAALAGAH